jgi:hypothetical protein
MKGETKSKSNHYVNNEDMLKALIEYKKNPTERLLNVIGRMIMKISEHAIMSPSFMNYTNDRKLEMVSDANYLMCKYCINSFDPTKSSNPFAYFSQTAYNAFLLHIKKQKERESLFSNISYIDNLEDNEIDALGSE